MQVRYQEISKVFSLIIHHTPRSGATFWTPPPPDHIKINVDAALSSSKSTLAVVARNHLGGVLFGWGKGHHLCHPL